MNSGSVQYSDRMSKPLKLCFKNEIHRVAKLPSDYKTLVENVQVAFKSSLPNNWALQYEDADGDHIMLTSNEDYHAMLECELESSSKSIKIFLVPMEERVPTEMSSSRLNLEDISKTESMVFSRMPEPVVEEKREQEVEIKKSPEVEIEEIKEIPKEVQPEVAPVTQETQPSNYFDVTVDVEQMPREEVPKKCCAKREERRCKREGFHAKMQERKKEKMRGIVTDILLENVPILAELMKEYLENPSASTFENLKNKVQEQKEEKKPAPSEKFVHYRVTCDGCGTNPIVGARYKCSICEDFDYCEKCEASIEHPHPFLKIKDPKHHPRALVAIIDEDVPEQGSFDIRRSIFEKLGSFSKETKDQVSKAINGFAEKIFAPASQPQEVEKSIEKIKIEEPEEVQKHKKERVIIEEVKEMKPVKEESSFDLTFIKEVCTIPAKITVNDKVIYKTISVKNTGKREWPCNAVLKNVGGVSGQDTKVVQLAPGKDFSCILIIESPGTAGDYSSSWKFAHHDDKGELQFIGEEFKVFFTVIEPELSQSQMPKIVEEKPKKVEEEPKKVEEKPKKVYSKKVQDLAKQVKEIFADADLDGLLEVIEMTPNITLQELLENYMN